MWRQGIVAAAAADVLWYFYSFSIYKLSTALATGFRAAFEVQTGTEV